VQPVEALDAKLSTYLAPDLINQVRRAYLYAEQAHNGQVRRTGEPYVTHPLAVADILADMHMDQQSLVAALLHDVIEDTGISREALAAQFGDTVADLVDGVSKLTQIDFATRAEAQAENFQKMALAMARDIRVILVKLADRLHNMRTLDVLGSEKRRRIARETLDIYAPIALRLGMNNVRMEFEDLSFAILYPMRARRIKAAVKNATGNRKELLDKIRHKIELCLEEEGHQARVIGREKHLYSIYEKMRSKGKAFSEIMDVLAYRIIVDSVDTCYRVLGAVHNLYKPVPGLFKDYVAIPKANGYQSLHTVLFGMHGIPIEIQIRTQEMEEMANNGIAAHWLYKTKSENSAIGAHTRARQWVQGLLEMQQRAGDSMEFIENVKIDLFPDEVYVFTPNGDIFELPVGATAVDFAYAVHTDVGNTCVACRINRRLAPLSEPLQSGQTVEVITAPGAQPNPAWLNFVVTGKARGTIRHFLKKQKFSDAITLGKRLLEKALNTLDSSLEKFDQAQIARLLEETGHDDFESLLEEIGLGNRVAYITARRMIPEIQAESMAQEVGVQGKTGAAVPLVIKGTEGLIINFAKCCHPIPGDPILGHISAGRGIVVHLESCNNIAELRGHSERCISLGWADEVEGEFTVELRVELESHRGMIAILANKINSLDVSIEKISVEEKDPRFSIVHLMLAVRNRVHLARIMRRIRSIKSVIKVSRTRH
jgi:RelA/SpoT family (p)ppGpp synthetase